MNVVKLIITFSILTLIVFLALQDEKAVTLEEQMGVYPSSFPPPSLREEVSLSDIFFDQREFRLREDAKPLLKDNAEILMQNPDISIVIWGYCNNQEYTSKSNLGQKRAETTKNYLTSLGVESHRMSLLTRCRGDSDVEGLSGHLNVAWELNSRVHFTPMKKEGGETGLISRRLVKEGNLRSCETDGILASTIVSLDPIYRDFESDERSILIHFRPVREGERPSSCELATSEGTL